MPTRRDERLALLDQVPVVTRSTLGSRLRGWRMRHSLTLKEMSARTGVPFSTLSKVEHDRLTLTFEKLQTVSERLGIPMAALFAEHDGPKVNAANGRRSIANRMNAFQVKTPIYDYFYMSPELRNKAMIPILAHIKARTIEEFGDLVRHRGEEFFYVLEGSVVVHTDFYDPIVLTAGEAVYIDSTMGHAYLLAGQCASATALCVCSTSQEELISNAATFNERTVDHLPVGAKPKRSRPSRKRADSKP